MRLAVVTNILTPYRMRFYSELYNQLKASGGDFKVYVMTRELPLRPWNYDALKTDFTELLPGRKIMYKGLDILFNKSINKWLNAFQPDVVILAGSWTYPTSWKMMNHKSPNAKYYFWTESHNVRGKVIASKSGFVQSLKKSFYKKFDGYCIPGKYATETVNDLVGNFGKRVRLPNLVDDAYYAAANEMRKNKMTIRRKYDLKEDKTIFVTPARLIHIKGMDIFLNQIKENPNIKNATFVLAGEGPLDEEFKRLNRETDLDIVLLGYCNQETVRELYSAADLFLLPSLADANPLTVIEASFSGLPLCVSHYVGNSPELCKDYDNGVVFDTNDMDSVNHHFDFVMMSDEKWRQNAGAKSFDIARENFVCENETRKFISTLSKQ